MDNKRNRGIPLPPEDDEEIRLIDEDDLLQYFLGDPNKKKQPRKNDLDTFSLITFLENDGKRLDKLIHLFANKLDNHQKYNQAGQLLENQNDINENLKAQIIAYSRPLFSPVNKALAQMFDSQFKKN